MRKFTIGGSEAVVRNGRAVSFGVGEAFCPTRPYLCPPRPWEPDPGPAASIADRLGTGAPVGVSGLACWPREWKPQKDRALGVGAGPDTLSSGQSLAAGQSVQSPSGRGTLTMQPDGNLVLYDAGAQPQRPLWASITAGHPGASATMQADGNLVVYDGAHKPLWASNTSGHPGAVARLQDDGNLVVYAGASPLWASSTMNWQPAPAIHHGFSLDVGKIGTLVQGALKDVGKVASEAERFAGKEIKVATDVAGELVTDPKRFVHDIGHFATDVTKVCKFVLEETAGLVSLVPGLGTAISTAIAAGLAVLEGGGALEMAIKIAYGAIPIPPGVKFFADLVRDAVIDLVNAVVKGGDLLQMLERLIAEELAKALPDNVRSAGTNMLAALTPTVLQALTGKLPSAAAVASAASTVPGLPSVTATLPAVSIPPIPGVTGALGDKVDDFVAQLKSQYAAMNLPANVKEATDPIFNALVSMVHSMDVGPAILLAVRTGISAKLPAGAVRDLGTRVFDTLAHLILGKLFHHAGPTQAKTTAKLSAADLTAVHRAAALGQPLPPTVTPVPNTVAAYQPLATAEQAKGDTKVSITIPPGGYVYGPYPQPIAANTSPAAGTTAGVGTLERGHGGHGGHGGGHGGGHARGGRPIFRGRGGYGRGGWGWGGAWWPYVVATVDETACASWGDPIAVPRSIFPSLHRTLTGSGGGPVAVRGADGGLYLLTLDIRNLITVRPCVSLGIGSADDDALRLMAQDLLSSLRAGVPQGATRSVRAFAQAWNTASADTQISTDGKYTREIEAALDAALSALSPTSGAAPAAVL